MSKKQTLNDYLREYGRESRMSDKFRQSDAPRQRASSAFAFDRKANAKDIRDNDPRSVNPFSFRIQTNSNFNNAKYECLQLIQSIRSQIKAQRDEMQAFAQQHIRRVHDKLRSQFQNMKKHLLQVIEKGFRENEAAFQQRLKNQGVSSPVVFGEVYHKLDDLMAQLDRLEQGLNSQQYKKYISETVRTQFDPSLRQIHDIVADSIRNFQGSEPEISIRSERIQCVINDIKNLVVIGGGQVAPPISLPPRDFRKNSTLSENRDKLRQSMFRGLMQNMMG